MEKQFEIINIGLSDFVQSCIGEKDGKVVCHIYLPEYKVTEKIKLQTEVMNDALNIHFETGYTTSELLRQNREMREALEKISATAYDPIQDESNKCYEIRKVVDCLTSLNKYNPCS